MTDIGTVLFRTAVKEGWIDYNAHMTEGAYGIVFGDASDALLEHAGFDSSYRAEERGTFYTAEAHISFLTEVPATSTIEVGSIVVGVDEKRLHVLHTLMDITKSERAATQESMLLHVDFDTGRVRPMAPTLRMALEGLRDEHAGSELPPEIGRAIRSVSD